MQKCLIDTQILIWALISPSKLSEHVTKLMSSAAMCVSRISLLEIAIKQSVGKLPELPVSIENLERIILRDGFEMLNVETKHISAYNSIPLVPDHRDPFDRFLLATAYSEQIPVVSADENFRHYQNMISLIQM